MAAMEITLMQPAGLVASPAFSHVAIVPAGATTIYVGGQNGVDATGSVVSSDIAEQSSRAIDNASIALEAAGASLADVVQWSVLLERLTSPPQTRDRHPLARRGSAARTVPGRGLSCGPLIE